MALKSFPSADHQSSPQWNHVVFLSFRGVDTRNSFVSHLYRELQVQCIKTFKDDRKLERGATISSELLNAIEQSRLAVIILSPNYASSTWCLDELTKILQCMKPQGTVLPVFYKVNPSDVRKQSGSFAKAFAEHEERFKEEMEKVKQWRAALTQVANLSGLECSEERCETELLQEIVAWVWSKVRSTFKLLDSSQLVGIKFVQVHSLLAPAAEDVRFIGIWGMGGIGKTTTAKLVYDSISINFEVTCFLADVREVSERGNLVDLQRQLLFPIFLEEQITQVWDEQLGTSVIKNCFRNKKVLLVLDDVNESSQLEKLVGGKDWFGKGSRIIITTRDERLLVEHDIQISYKMEGLNNDEALELFSRNAFKKYEPEDGFLELSKCFVNYVKGLPLALKALGCSMYKRGLDEWKSELDKLQKIPESTIFDVLKISYDGLDEMNKNIFLDVAFFHKGKGKEQVIEILEGCDLCGRIGLHVLNEKSLLSIGKCSNVEMHDLIQEMALEIVRRESRDEPGERSRLSHGNDICHVFRNDTATSKTKGISLRTAVLEKADWNCEAFSKMINLKYLEFDAVIISSGPRILPNSLRIIKWSWYPSKCLPLRFRPNFLTELNMQKSKLVRLWDGTKDLPNLKSMDLSFSENLTCTPDFTGIPKLKQLYLQCCGNLVEIHLSIGVLKWLEILELYECRSIKCLPIEVETDSLKVLDLGCCSKVKKIPEFGGQMKEYFSGLHLAETAIEKLPSSIERLVGMTTLDLRYCKNLLGLPNAVCNLKSLRWLYMSGCSNVDNLPENFGELECLSILDLSGTAIRELPRSFVGLKNLKELSFRGLQPKPRHWWGLPGLYQRKGPHPLGLLLGSRDGLCSLQRLDLGDCNLGEGDIPDDIGLCLPSLQELKIFQNNFVSLPASIRCLSKLESLDLSNCQRLQQLPDLPSNRRLKVWTKDCTSLKLFSDPPKLSREVEMQTFLLDSTNCFGLVDKEGCNSIILATLWRFLRVFPNSVKRFEIVTPGRKIPEWFNNQSLGESLNVELPPHSGSKWMGIALCAVFEDEGNPDFYITCFSELFSDRHWGMIGHVVSDHLWVLYLSRNDLKSECSQKKILFQTHNLYPQRDAWCRKTYCLGVKQCGFRLVHEQDVEQLHQVMMNQSMITRTTTSPYNSADAQGDQRWDDHHDEAGPTGIGSSDPESICCKSYALSKGFLTKLTKIFSLFLTTAVFIEIFKNSKRWGCIGLLIWRVTTLIWHLGLAPSYFLLLLKSLIKTVILNRGGKFLLLLKTPRMPPNKYLKG